MQGWVILGNIVEKCENHCTLMLRDGAEIVVRDGATTEGVGSIRFPKY
jgi:hypothetical protein